jgi:hypothetical protein
MSEEPIFGTSDELTQEQIAWLWQSPLPLNRRPLPERGSKMLPGLGLFADVSLPATFKPFPPGMTVFRSSEYLPGVDCTRLELWKERRPIYESETPLDKLWSWIWRKL